MTEFILLLLGIAIGIPIGWKYREITAFQAVRKYQQQLANAAMEKTVFISVSKLEDQFLVHNQETGEFLAQGTTHEEIRSLLNKRYPDRVFVADPKNLREVGYKHERL